MLQISLAMALSFSTGCSTLLTIGWKAPDPTLPPDSTGEAPPDHRARATSQPPSVLWIDDDIWRDDAVVRLLEMEGFRVECARSGATGMAMALRSAYAGIILDLRLPDIPGLTVLETLRRHQIPTPILVLTGYPDFGVAVQAMRLGAWDCQSKAVLLGDTWIDLVRALAEHRDRMHGGNIGLLSAHGATVRELLELLEDMHKGSEVRDRAAEQAQLDLERLTLRLLRTLADRRVNVFLFLVCAKALRLTAGAPPHALPSTFLEISVLVETAAGRDTVTPDWRVQATLAQLAGAETQVGQLREEEIARALGVNRAHLGRLLRNGTGFTFRQWRWGFLLRPAIVLLATSQEQIAQIAYWCGYASLAQFDHDFRRMLHMTPTEYRQLVHNTSR